jgi:uncharacterized damage-inducible protein DinB
MKQLCVLVCLNLAAGLAMAQSGAPANPFSLSAKGVYVVLKTNVVKAAEKMPEENYSFKPTPDIRSFGQIVGHIADAQYIFCSMASGTPNNGPGVEKNKTTKADLVSALKEAFAYCDAVYDGMTDASGAQIIKFLGRDAPRITALTFNAAHMDEHYGNIVTYMRLKGLVPPSSEPAPATK